MNADAARKLKPLLGGSDENEYKTMRRDIENRQTEELVIGFCGFLGSGCSSIAKLLHEIFLSYGYTVEYVKISDFLLEILKNSIKNKDELSKSLKDPDIRSIKSWGKLDKIEYLQDVGNYIRKVHSTDFLSQYIVNKIAHSREFENQKPKIKSRRHVTIIDSLKHPDEIKLLEKIYGNMFYLFGLLCPEEARSSRLVIKDSEAKRAAFLIDRDKRSSIPYEQQVLKTIQSAHIFIRSTDAVDKDIKDRLIRYFKLILGNPHILPTIDEFGMFTAESAACRSGCLSRQVGASIFSEFNELLATGCNDAPKFGGGHYISEGTDYLNPSDNRCCVAENSECLNSKYSKEIMNEIKEVLNGEITDISEEKINLIISKLSDNTRLGSLIEFSKAVHAEMDAITTVARQGRGSLRNATLYCTTFPCHLCATNIIASGITKIYYIEPYIKSLALDLHESEVDFDPSKIEKNGSKKIRKVMFIPFEGVAPKKYIDFFKLEKNRKIDGIKDGYDESVSKPGKVQMLHTYFDFEAKIVKPSEPIIKSIIDENAFKKLIDTPN